MRLNGEEVQYVRSMGLFITERCDHCGKVLNQTFHYTMAGRTETWCSRSCQDEAIGWGTMKGAPPKRKCVVCGSEVPGLRSGKSTTCSRACSNRLDYRNRKKAVA